jgi:hypothetical protein
MSKVNRVNWQNITVGGEGQTEGNQCQVADDNFV